MLLLIIYVEEKLQMIKKGMLFILSILPVFAVTDDSNFGTVESNNKFWRFSLVQIMCGATKFYFISLVLSQYSGHRKCDFYAAPSA